MKRSTIAFVVLAVVISALYAGTVEYPFVFDDDHVITANKFIQNPSHIPEFFHHLGMFTGQKLGWGSYRPLLYATYAVNYMMTGLDPLSYHLTNILIHILSSFMVFLLARSLIGFSPPRPGGLATEDNPEVWPYAFGAALLFAVHPLQTEPAIYASARSAELVTLNCLASLWLFVQYRRRGRLSWLLASGVMYGLALFSKERAVPFLLIFPLVDRYLSKVSGNRTRWYHYAPHFVLAGAFVALRAEIMVLYGSDGAFSRSFTAQWLSATAALSEYGKLLFLPVNQSIDHDAITVAGAVNVNLLIGAFIIAGTAALFARYYRRDPLVSALVAWPLLTMSPEILMPIKDIIVEYRMYLPMAGISILAAYSVRGLVLRLDRRRAVAVAAVCVSVLYVLPVLSYKRSLVWASPKVLWGDAVSNHPFNARARNNFGWALGASGDNLGAVAQLEEAVRLDPGYADAYNNLGTAYANMGMLVKSIVCYRKALDIDPGHYDAGYNLALSLIDTGNPEGALDVYSGMMKAHADDRDILYMAVRVFEARGLPVFAGRMVAAYGTPANLAMHPRNRRNKAVIRRPRYNKKYRR